ncbi:hypothetical protein DCAR_0727218 [Daucus carota subsp. sativus]|uniref:Uncharacterized protein n=1 Tax=Daucus carota subsp. sativus TaxID=79200 RepID=A0A161WQJ4_DAUCS|nr:hypothetical protein DCAR_0727218 [Daucus carota subsp. sativus]
MKLDHVSRVLDNPIRYKDFDQEIHINSLKELKTIIVKGMYTRVIGSLKNLEAQFAEECEVVLESRENEDLELDEKRRETLYSVPGRKFRMNRNEMEFRCCNSGHKLWFTLDGARDFGSFALQKRIEEIEDFIETLQEAALIADLNLLVDERKREEQKAKGERKAKK